MTQMPYCVHNIALALLTVTILATPVAHAQEMSPTIAPWRNALYLTQEPTIVVDAFQLAVLEATNTVRSSAVPAPSPALSPMVWDSNAAKVAQAWADRCNWAHNSDRSSDYNALTGGSAYVGENLYGRTGSSTFSELASQGITGWADEVVDYEYSNNSCSGVCGHYTQLVWRSTTAVGCAVSNCPNIWPGSGPGQILVCNYVPGGNYVGQRPY